MSDEKTPPLRPLSPEEMNKRAKEFKDQMTDHLREDSEKYFTTVGAPEILCFSTTYGEYTGKNFGLYISKNLEKEAPADVELAKAYLKMEKGFWQGWGMKFFGGLTAW